MIPRVVFDTNIYLSAILPPGKSRQVLELARKGDIELLVSEAILAEVERVLKLKFFRADLEIDLILTCRLKEHGYCRLPQEKKLKG